MALYTTSLEVMVNNLCEDRTKPLAVRIESARPKIFDFSFPAPNSVAGEAFVKYFETAFINKYLFDEIAFETVGRFKQRLQSKTLEIMPRYKSIFNILEKLDYSKIYDNNDYHETGTSKQTNKSKTTATNNGVSKGQSAGSNLPENMLAKGDIGNFENIGYADTAAITKAVTDANSKSDNESSGTNNNEISRTGRTISQLDTLRSIDSDFNAYFEDLLNEYKQLFMQLIF